MNTPTSADATRFGESLKNKVLLHEPTTETIIIMYLHRGLQPNPQQIYCSIRRESKITVPKLPSTAPEYSQLKCHEAPEFEKI